MIYVSFGGESVFHLERVGSIKFNWLLYVRNSVSESRLHFNFQKETLRVERERFLLIVDISIIYLMIKLNNNCLKIEIDCE